MAQVSVVMPVYNGERYLASAVRSALAQTYLDYELIVVDDGSTDATPQIASQFGNALRYLRQNNQGQAAARNTAIHQASGEYVAFLDSDDEWLPGYLEMMLALAAANPQCAVSYSCARCIDSAGRDLPQLAGAKLVAANEMYRTLVDANFLIPSTTLIRREALVAAGGFDQTQPAMNGCEDWDLWLRLARRHQFIGTLDCLARYRVHSHSTSANVDKMHRAARTVIEKHFGPDDDHPEAWNADKRRAFGGLYLYHVLTYVARQGNWVAAIPFQKKALEANPALSDNLDYFYELALGDQPLGYRGAASMLELESNARQVARLLQQVFDPGPGNSLRALRQRTYGTAYYALGMVAYNTGQTRLSRMFLSRAGVHRIGCWLDRRFLGLFLKSLAGHNVLAQAKRLSSNFTKTSRNPSESGQRL